MHNETVRHTNSNPFKEKPRDRPVHARTVRSITKICNGARRTIQLLVRSAQFPITYCLNELVALNWLSGPVSQESGIKVADFLAPLPN